MATTLGTLLNIQPSNNNIIFECNGYTSSKYTQIYIQEMSHAILEDDDVFDPVSVCLHVL